MERGAVDLLHRSLVGLGARLNVPTAGGEEGGVNGMPRDACRDRQRSTPS